MHKAAEKNLEHLSKPCIWIIREILLLLGAFNSIFFFFISPSSLCDCIYVCVGKKYIYLISVK